MEGATYKHAWLLEGEVSEVASHSFTPDLDGLNFNKPAQFNHKKELTNAKKGFGHDYRNRMAVTPKKQKSCYS